MEKAFGFPESLGNGGERGGSLKLHDVPTIELVFILTFNAAYLSFSKELLEQSSLGYAYEYSVNHNQ